MGKGKVPTRCLGSHHPVGPLIFHVATLNVVSPILWSFHADYKYTKITIVVLCVPEYTDGRPPFAEWVVQPWWKDKIPPAALNWVLAVSNLIHTGITNYFT